MRGQFGQTNWAVAVSEDVQKRRRQAIYESEEAEWGIHFAEMSLSRNTRSCY